MPCEAVPKHVAIIMDGNGRWATAQGKDRSYGHVEGVAALRRTVAAAAKAGIETLTVYAFSSENWARPTAEVDALMALMAHTMPPNLPQREYASLLLATSIACPRAHAKP